jgi:hypothetical protein
MLSEKGEKGKVIWTSGLRRTGERLEELTPVLCWQSTKARCVDLPWVRLAPITIYHVHIDGLKFTASAKLIKLPGLGPFIRYQERPSSLLHRSPRFITKRSQQGISHLSSPPLTLSYTNDLPNRTRLYNVCEEQAERITIDLNSTKSRLKGVRSLGRELWVVTFKENGLLLGHWYVCLPHR